MERDKSTEVAIVGTRGIKIIRGNEHTEEFAKGGLEIPVNMKPSPTMKVHFSDGEVVQMNRRERRRRHLYGDQLHRTKTRPSPPPIFHGQAEMEEGI